MPWSAFLAATACALALVLLTPWVLRRLPEPAAADAEGKRPYASLATPGFVGTTALVGLACALAAFAWTPPAHWIAWSALAGVNVLACAIDARTTWLPVRLSKTGWVVAALGASWVAMVGRSWTPLLAAGACALLAGGFFHLVWRLTGGIGYGDVRLAATIGAVTGLASPALVGWSLALGTLTGALVGVGHHVRGSRGAFAYGPGLLAGPFLALALLATHG